MAEKKVAIITGGTRGIGKAIVEYLANADINSGIKCDVVFTYNSSDAKAQELVESLSESGAEIHAMKVNAASFDDAQKVIDFTMEKFGRVDVMVNNAGITRDNLLIRMSEEEFDQVIDVNLKGVFNYCKAAVKVMMRKKYGRIVNLTSVVGLIGNAGQTNYVASKAGVMGITKTLAKEYAAKNVSVNAIAPGFIDTEMTEAVNDKAREAMLATIPMKRAGKPLDIAKVVGFLISDAADYVTGQVITVDGGMVM